MFRPSQLFPFLRAHEILPKKGLSQNFLVDGNIIRKILHAAKVSKGDFIIEIGPGPGALTEALLQAGASVLAIEKDCKLSEALYRLQTPDRRLEILEEDVLDFSFETALKNRPKAKIISNLPYHITAPILGKTLLLSPYVDSMTLMVQKEVAQRMVAKPGSKEFSCLSLFVAFYSRAVYCFSVRPNSFFPVPKVDSAVVHLELKTAAVKGGAAAFFHFVHQAFQQRRKMVKSSLKKLYPADFLGQVLTELSLNEKLRPENLSLDQWISLFERLQRNAIPSNPPKRIPGLHAFTKKRATFEKNDLSTSTVAKRDAEL